MRWPRCGRVGADGILNVRVIGRCAFSTARNRKSSVFQQTGERGGSHTNIYPSLSLSLSVSPTDFRLYYFVHTINTYESLFYVIPKAIGI